MKNNYFLRAFELKDKFCHVIKQDIQKKHVIRELSACITERFNGFNMVRLELDKRLRRGIKPLDIIINPSKIIPKTSNVSLVLL